MKKSIKLHFYSIALQGVSDPLLGLFKNHIDNGENPAQKIQENHYIQIQELGFLGEQERIVRGIVKKFMPKQESPLIGEVGKTNERPIPMDDNESLVEKTFFLYDTARGILLYQSNRSGTSVKNFGQYLSVLCSSKFTFAPVLTNRAYTNLRDGVAMKKLAIRVARPTNAEPIRKSKNKWADNQTQFLQDMGGLQLKLEVGLGRAGKSTGALAPAAWDFIRAIKEKFADKAKGSIVVVDDDNLEHEIDLVMDKMFTTADIPMSGAYPVTDAMFRAMLGKMIEAGPELDLIFGADG